MSYVDGFVIPVPKKNIADYRKIARKAGKVLPEEATVTAAVSFADREDNVGFTMVTALEGKVPGWSKADIEATMKAAHDICPISDLIRHAHEVELKAAEPQLA